MKKQFGSYQVSAIIFAGLLVYGSTAHAQNSASASVTASLYPMDPVIVTATRTPTRANDVLADNVYISSEEIKQAGQTSLVELLQQQRGVEISSVGGPGSPASVFLRGANSNQTLVLIDGVRTQSALSGSSTLQAIPLGIIDHIEIVFGPQSSLYGSDAIGGVIQIFTKKGTGTPQVDVSTGYGGYGTSITDASLFGSIGETNKTSYSLSASQEISTGFSSIAANNPCNPNTQSSSTLSSNYCGSGLSMARTGYTKSGASGKLSQEWEQGQEFGIQFLASRLDNQYPVSDYFGGGIGSQINNLGVFSAFSNNQINQYWKSSLQISQSYDLGQYIYTSGNPITNTKLSTYTWQNDISIYGDLLQLVAERKTANAIANDGNINQDQNTNTLAGAYKLQRGNHLANIAIRNDSITGYGPQTTGSASYGYFFTQNVRANINYGTGFKAPSFYDLYYPLYGNTNLQAEKSKNTEIGLHYESRQLELHATAFNSTINNLIQYTTTSPPCTYEQINYGSQGGCAGNVGVAKISGVSLGGLGRVSDFVVRGSFDQQNPIEQSTGYLLAKRARQFGNIAAEYTVKSTKIGLEGTFQGGRYNSSNSNYMGGYGIYNLYANHEIEKNLSIFARWNNMFNKDYQLSYGYNTPGSNVFVGLRYAMK